MSNSPTNYPLANGAVGAGALVAADQILTSGNIFANIASTLGNVVGNVGSSVNGLVNGTAASTVPVVNALSPLINPLEAIYALYRGAKSTGQHGILRGLESLGLTYGTLELLTTAAGLGSMDPLSWTALGVGLGGYGLRKTYAAGSQFLEHPVENTLHIPKKLFSWSGAALNRIAFGKNKSATA